MIIGICSDFMGAGKDFAADYLVDRFYPDAKKYAFANKLKALIQDLFGLSINTMPSEEKQIECDLILPDISAFHHVISPIMETWKHAYINQNGKGVESRIIDKTNKRGLEILANTFRYELVNQFTLEAHEGITISPRRLMTFIGSDFFRSKVHNAFWATLLRQEILQQNMKYSIISDVRYLNEANIVEKLIYIESPTNPHKNDTQHAHTSEAWTPPNPDFHLINRYDDEFSSQLEAVACQLLEKE